jgi:hypothetical protein
VDAVTELQRKLSHYENEMSRMQTEINRLIKKDNNDGINPTVLGEDSKIKLAEIIFSNYLILKLQLMYCTSYS